MNSKNNYVYEVKQQTSSEEADGYFFIIWFVRLLALRPLLAYCASLG
jgi:hypothetical protein